MIPLERKLLKNTVLDENLLLKITKSESAERIFVEFSSKDGKLVIQKSFQDNYYGRIAAKEFEDKFQNIEELKKHFNNKGK